MSKFAAYVDAYGYKSFGSAVTRQTAARSWNYTNGLLLQLATNITVSIVTASSSHGAGSSLVTVGSLWLLHRPGTVCRCTSTLHMSSLALFTERLKTELLNRS